jgi:hypothetical protein
LENQANRFTWKIKLSAETKMLKKIGCESIWNPETILVCAFGGGWFMEREVWRNQAKMEWDE